MSNQTLPSQFRYGSRPLVLVRPCRAVFPALASSIFDFREMEIFVPDIFGRWEIRCARERILHTITSCREHTTQNKHTTHKPAAMKRPKPGKGCSSGKGKVKGSIVVDTTLYFYSNTDGDHRCFSQFYESHFCDTDGGASYCCGTRVRGFVVRCPASELTPPSHCTPPLRLHTPFSMHTGP